MAGSLTPEEERQLEKALAEATESQRKAALLSWESLKAFLKRVGLYWLIEKIVAILDEVIEWLRDIFS